MNTNILDFRALTGEQLAGILKTVIVGCVIVAISYSAYKNGYSFEGSYNDITIKLKPA